MIPPWDRRYQKPFLAIFLLIVFLQLIAWDLKGGGFWDTPYNILITVSSLPLKAVTGAVHSVKGMRERVILTKNLREENLSLRKEIASLKAERREAEEIARENARLRDLLDFRERRSFPTLLSHVIGGDPTNSFQTIFIDKGKKAHLSPGMAVVTAGGIVGQIMKVAPTTSQVLLMTDNNSSVDVLIERSRAKGILTGWRGEVCQIKYLGRTEDVQVGDMVITSGLGGVFPKGIEVGTVKEVEKKSWGVFQRAYVYPSVDFGKLEEVLVVRESAPRRESSEAGQP